jgi:hypothetical protein
MSSKEEKLNALTQQISAEVADGKKPSAINKYMKNFFFKALKRKPEIKAVEKVIGSLTSITMMMSEKKNLLRAESEKGREDIDMTKEEVEKFLKTFNVKQSSVDDCKSVFVQLNFSTLLLSIQLNKNDGTQENIYI